MKRISKTGIFLVLLAGMGLLLESCASSRSNCNCNDLSKHYKAPKSYKRNVY